MLPLFGRILRVSVRLRDNSMLNHSNKWVLSRTLPAWSTLICLRLCQLALSVRKLIKNELQLQTRRLTPASRANPFSQAKDDQRQVSIQRTSHNARLAQRTGHAESTIVTLWYTTGVLTTTVLIYTFRAGITAGAGTRLVL